MMREKWSRVQPLAKHLLLQQFRLFRRFFRCKSLLAHFGLNPQSAYPQAIKIEQAKVVGDVYEKVLLYAPHSASTDCMRIYADDGLSHGECLFICI
jgi:hypothetical protein